MYVLSWRTVSALTRVLFWNLFPSLLRNSGNKHQNNPLVSAETIPHSITYIFLYFLHSDVIYQSNDYKAVDVYFIVSLTIDVFVIRKSNDGGTVYERWK